MFSQGKAGVQSVPTLEANMLRKSYDTDHKYQQVRVAAELVMRAAMLLVSSSPCFHSLRAPHSTVPYRI